MTAEFPGLAIGFLSLFQGEGWWTSGHLLEVGTPGPGIRPGPWLAHEPTGQAAERLGSEARYARDHGREITALGFGIHGDTGLGCSLEFAGAKGNECAGLQYLGYLLHRYPGCRLFWGPMGPDSSTPDDFFIVAEARGSIVACLMPLSLPDGFPVTIPGARCELPATVSRLWPWWEQSQEDWA